MSGELKQLLADVHALVRHYIVLSDDQALVVALWVIHTHVLDAFEFTPYLAITSAEKQSGKTLLLELLAKLSAKPWLTGSVTAAVLARKIDKEQPTLLLDESDAAFKAEREYAETLRGVLNTGFKRSGCYSRCVGNGADLHVADFKTFCPKAIAGIDRLPDTVADRSIPIRLKKKAPHEAVDRFREREVEAATAPVRDRLAAWAASEDNVERLVRLELAPPDELGDRAADIWEPLLAIAYLAGEMRWYPCARKAAAALSGRAVAIADDQSIGVRLLADIKTIFADGGLDRITSAALVGQLVEIEESPWAEWRHGRPLSTNGLAEILHRYEIRPRTIRTGEQTAKGYHRDQFDDAWLRHLPSHPARAVTPSQSAARQLEQQAGLPSQWPSPQPSRADRPRAPACDGVTDTGQGRQLRPLPGDDDYRQLINTAFERGQITELERHTSRVVHGLIYRARSARS